MIGAHCAHDDFCGPSSAPGPFGSIPQNQGWGTDGARSAGPPGASATWRLRLRSLNIRMAERFRLSVVTRGALVAVLAAVVSHFPWPGTGTKCRHPREDGRADDAGGGGARETGGQGDSRSPLNGARRSKPSSTRLTRTSSSSAFSIRRAGFTRGRAASARAAALAAVPGTSSPACHSISGPRQPPL